MLRVVASGFEVTEDDVVPVYRKPSGGVGEYAATGNAWACLEGLRTPEARSISLFISSMLQQ